MQSSAIKRCQREPGGIDLSRPLWIGFEVVVGEGSSAAGDRPTRHYTRKMGAILGAGVDVGVEPVLRDCDVLDRVGGEGACQCRLHLGGAEDARPFFFFNDTATTEIYTLSLHDALPI